MLLCALDMLDPRKLGPHRPALTIGWDMDVFLCVWRSRRNRMTELFNMATCTAAIGKSCMQAICDSEA